MFPIYNNNNNNNNNNNDIYKHHHNKNGICYFIDQHYLRPNNWSVTMEKAMSISLQNQTSIYYNDTLKKKQISHSLLRNCTRI